MLRIMVMGILANLGLLSMLNNKGEIGADGKEVASDKVQDKLLTQAQVDAIVQDRLARERGKYSDYEDLKKFKTEFEKNQDAKQLALLEEQKKYNEAKDSYEKKIAEAQGLISKKDAEITDMKIGSSLMGEIVKQNAYAEETMALMKQQAVFDKEGNIRIKGRDANGLEVLDSVEEGVKKFLLQRPHLVKATKPGGGGTPSGNQTAGNIGGDDLNSLNEELMQATRRGDFKKVKEIKVKVAANIAAQRAKL